MNKRGSVEDVILLTVFVFMIGLGFLVFNPIAHTLSNSFANNSLVNASNGSVTAFKSIGTNADKLDYLTVVLYIGFLLALIITGYLIDVKSIFFVVYLIVLVLAVFVSAILSYVYEYTASTSIFSTYATNLPITNFILSYLPIFVTVAGCVSLVVLYAKERNGGGI